MTVHLVASGLHAGHERLMHDPQAHTLAEPPSCPLLPLAAASASGDHASTQGPHAPPSPPPGKYLISGGIQLIPRGIYLWLPALAPGDGTVHQYKELKMSPGCGRVVGGISVMCRGGELHLCSAAGREGSIL